MQGCTEMTNVARVDVMVRYEVNFATTVTICVPTDALLAGVTEMRPELTPMVSSVALSEDVAVLTTLLIEYWRAPQY
jgi:hypothetical protein